MKNSENIRWDLQQLYDANDTYEPDYELERKTLEQVQAMAKDPANEFTDEDNRVWSREIEIYNYDKENVTILDVLDNLMFYIEQPDEYRRVNDWRV